MAQIFGADWEPQYPLGYWTVDSAVPSLRLVVQADGDYWHGHDLRHRAHPTVERNRRNDRRCDTYCAENGWTVLRLWDAELLDDHEWCAAAIREAAEL